MEYKLYLNYKKLYKIKSNYYLDISDLMNVVLKKLKKYYNYDSLYNFQENVIKNVLNGKDIFVLAKTSGGKSICYQLPALVVRGITIIICPLRSLIEDQVNNLKKKKY